MSICPTPPARPRRRPVPPPPPEIGEGEPVPPGMVRLLSGQLVSEEEAAQVIPGELPPEARWPGEASPAPEAHAPTYRREPPGACCAHTFDPEALHDELDALRAQAAQLREDLARSEGRAEGLAHAIALLAPSLAVPAPVPGASRPAVPMVVPPVPGDMSPLSPGTDGDMKGGRGEAAATATKDEKRREYEKLKKQKQRQKKRAAAESARDVSPVPCPPVPGDMSPVPLSRAGGDTSPAAPIPGASIVRKARPKWMEDDAPSPDKVFFAWTQEERCRRFGRAIPEAPPPGWATWYSDSLAAVGGDEGRLRAAWLAWLEDTWGQSRQPVCAARAFIGAEVWRRHVPGQGGAELGSVGPAQMPPAEARRRAQMSVGRGEEPSAPCATGCGTASSLVVWGHSLCRVCAAWLETDVPRLTTDSVSRWVESRACGALPAALEASP
ncbi:hypothetical protein [Corallococcus sp. AS-1-6]|uniref:hypothetical protein n=1 Tax=Corallococcus sp. AS-1-6 TaxID=2874599 RepID=UPI001CBE4577|nr:hypothetical protein [Corallococcus sp. AS-1-6]MBZ4373281.1 hypothetical protein [Corallococcus sp. AS-1-6]